MIEPRPNQSESPEGARMILRLRRTRPVLTPATRLSVLVPILAAMALPQQVRAAADATVQIEGEGLQDGAQPDTNAAREQAPPAKHAKWASPEAQTAKTINEQ